MTKKQSLSEMHLWTTFNLNLYDTNLLETIDYVGNKTKLY